MSPKHYFEKTKWKKFVILKKKNSSIKATKKKRNITLGLAQNLGISIRVSKVQTMKQAVILYHRFKSWGISVFYLLGRTMRSMFLSIGRAGGFCNFAFNSDAGSSGLEPASNMFSLLYHILYPRSKKLCEFVLSLWKIELYRPKTFPLLEYAKLTVENRVVLQLLKDPVFASSTQSWCSTWKHDNSIEPGRHPCLIPDGKVCKPCYMKDFVPVNWVLPTSLYTLFLAGNNLCLDKSLHLPPTSHQDKPHSWTGFPPTLHKLIGLSLQLFHVVTCWVSFFSHLILSEE